MKPGLFYLLYTHANGFDKLFKSDRNYRFFFNKYLQYSRPVCDTYAYRLMPHSIHLLIKVKEMNHLTELWKSKLAGKRGKKKTKTIELLISRQFGSLLNSYAQSFNKQQRRSGSLFVRSFRRKPVDITQLQTAVAYVHINSPSSAECLFDNWSSYSVVISNRHTTIKKNELVGWFGGLAEFKSYHSHFVAFQRYFSSRLSFKS